MRDDDDEEAILHPRDNPDLVGHEDIETQLLDSFNSGRMHHAWLISGPEGIGKATLAYRFARHILSQGANNEIPETAPDLSAGLFGEDPEPEVQDASEQGPLYMDCQTPVFRRVASGGHADLFSIERRRDEKTGKLKSAIVVDDVRGVGHFLSMTPAEGGWRVVVVDAADHMNINAANAILKVLEEPPKRAVLLLVCHNPGKLLPTIRSRCRTLQMRPLGNDTVASLAQDMIPDLSQREAERLASLSEGSIGRALRLADAGGLELWAELMGLMQSLPRLDVRAVHALADRVSRAGSEDAFDTVTTLVRWWLERMILNTAGGGAGNGAGAGQIGATNEQEAELAQRLSGDGSLDRWFKVWEKINHLVARTDAVNLDRKQVVLEMFLGLESAARPAR